jgi:hypothetical protein
MFRAGMRPSPHRHERYDCIRSARFVSSWNVTSVRRSSTFENSRLRMSSDTHSPKMSVMSPRNTRLPASFFDRSNWPHSFSHRNGSTFAISAFVNGPPRPYRLASVSL